jgi:putative SOS response-associated peptidase YedK
MCGRFRLARKKEILEESFGIDDVLDDLEWTPRYNVAPGQMIAVIRQEAGAEGARPARRLSQMRWGLIPYWAKEPAIGNKMINARSESVAGKAAFAEALRCRRCLIPADGFYEWKREGKWKQPYCFTLVDDAMFGFAGLWDCWRGPQGETVESCTILTGEANELLREIHDRMPVILPPDAYEQWLDLRVTDVQQLLPLLKPFPAAQMRGYRVSPRVNNVIYDDAECAAEVEAPAALFAE